MKNRIYELRKEKNVSQSELANVIGVTRQAVSLYEAGKREPKLATWQKLADFFKVPISYLQGSDAVWMTLIQNHLIKIINFEYFTHVDFDNPASFSKNELTYSITRLIKVLNLKKYPQSFYNIKSWDDFNKKNIDPSIQLKPELEEYWINNLNFLFKNYELLKLVRNSMVHGVPPEKVSKRIIKMIIHDINLYILINLSTPTGKRVLTRYKSKFDDIYNSFLTDISLADNLTDVEKSISIYKNEIDDLESDIRKNKKE